MGWDGPGRGPGPAALHTAWLAVGCAGPTGFLGEAAREKGRSVMKRLCRSKKCRIWWMTHNIGEPGCSVTPAK